jgi:hypothetical protein
MRMHLCLCVCVCVCVYVCVGTDTYMIGADGYLHRGGPPAGRPNIAYVSSARVWVRVCMYVYVCVSVCLRMRERVGGLACHRGGC